MNAYDQYGFKLENKKYVKHMAIKTGRALDNREIRVVAVPKNGMIDYTVSLVELSTCARKRLAGGSVKEGIIEDTLGDILSAADKLRQVFTVLKA